MIQAEILARVYQLILSWPEPDQQKTAPLADFSGKAGKAAGEAEVPVVASDVIITPPAGVPIEYTQDETETDNLTTTKTNTNMETTNDIVQNSEKNNRPDR